MVSVSTLAVAVAIIINIKRSYGSIEEDDIRLMEMTPQMAMHLQQEEGMIENLPAIVILTPLFGALISILLAVGPRLGLGPCLWSTCFVLSLMLIGQLQASGEAISYTMGRWPPEWGIEFRLDHLNAMSC